MPLEINGRVNNGDMIMCSGEKGFIQFIKLRTDSGKYGGGKKSGSNGTFACRHGGGNVFWQ